jgi:hypothetical protein
LNEFRRRKREQGIAHETCPPQEARKSHRRSQDDVLATRRNRAGVYDVNNAARPQRLDRIGKRRSAGRDEAPRIGLNVRAASWRRSGDLRPTGMGSAAKKAQKTQKRGLVRRLPEILPRCLRLLEAEFFCHRKHNNQIRKAQLTEWDVSFFVPLVARTSCRF